MAAKKSPAKTPAPATLPDIEVVATGGQRFRLPDLRGRNVILYFYPRDDTPGCTQEGCDVRDNFADFTMRDTVVFGVSRDPVDSHERFKLKYSFPFDLISDPDERLCRAFGVMQPKSLYGRRYIGVERSTFVYDREGKLRRELRGVKVPGHVAELLMELDRL
ncbi:MAG: peroxiredoxin [Candidatus Muproteobacteria bacterium RBG_16_62_13]|uniref:thioredoxin-dependent peroxiredoxin n=1 Tax=Candidatus Muproteobacteria bacterium RBG_16_62_13 TaxID=1817756 RepID=A0A1F6T922_9PROT|nr:MAG: peroxiredoxin [Candidatus Muproteobacteria bacterium RBG_16_62_13]